MGRPLLCPSLVTGDRARRTSDAEEDKEDALGLNGWDPEILSRYDVLLDGKLG